MATVKLVLETGVGVITRAWPLTQPAQLLRAQLSHTTQVPAQYLQVSPTRVIHVVTVIYKDACRL